MYEGRVLDVTDNHNHKVGVFSKAETPRPTKRRSVPEY